MPGTAAAAVGDTKTVPAGQWSAAVCKGFGRWQQQLFRARGTGTPADPIEGKATIVKFLAGAVQATDKLAAQVRAAGIPDVKNGKAIAAAFATSVKRQRAALTKVKSDAADLPTGDAAAFSTAVKALTSELEAAATQLSTTIGEAGERYPSSQLDEAFATAKACRASTSR